MPRGTDDIPSMSAAPRGPVEDRNAVPVGGDGGAKRRLTREEFAVRVQEAHRAVWTIAVAILSDRSAAEDAVQEAAGIALTKLGEFDPGTSFVAWFGQIVRYTALNDGRRRARTRAQGLDHVEAASPQARPAPAAFDDYVSTVLMSLEETPRTCLLMRTIHGMTFAEISAALGIPEGTAMSHVHRSRAVLRERLARIAEQGGTA